ncbi:MAG: acetylglutamate kinase [Thermoplasmatota archaeon]
MSDPQTPQHHGRPASPVIVVKLGGRTFENPAGRTRILAEIASLARGGLEEAASASSKKGFRSDADAPDGGAFATAPTSASGNGPVVYVVHGGGNKVSAELAAAGVTPKFVRGLRVTDEPTLVVVERVLTLAGKEIAHDLTNVGAPALALTGRDAGWLRARRREEWGYVGEVTRVDAAVLRRIARAGFVPVLAPIAFPDGGLGMPLNVNADEVAGAVANALPATELWLLTDVDAVIGPKGPVGRLTIDEARALIADGYAKDGMAPKLESAIMAAQGGVRVRIANGNQEGIIARLAHPEPVGTEVVRA